MWLEGYGPHEIPTSLSLVKLLFYDGENPQDILSASMYFNTMTSKSEADTFIDKLMQGKQLVQAYTADLAQNRKELNIQVTKKYHENDAGVAEIVKWLGVRADLFGEEQEFSESETQVGVVIRISMLVPMSFLDWVNQDLADKRFKEIVHGVLVQKVMSTDGIWRPKLGDLSRKPVTSHTTCTMSCTCTIHTHVHKTHACTGPHMIAHIEQRRNTNSESTSNGFLCTGPRKRRSHCPSKSQKAKLTGFWSLKHRR